MWQQHRIQCAHFLGFQFLLMNLAAGDVGDAPPLGGPIGVPKAAAVCGAGRSLQWGGAMCQVLA